MPGQRQPRRARPSRRALFSFLLLLLLGGLSMVLGTAARWLATARYVPQDTPPDLSAPAVQRAERALETAERTVARAAAAAATKGETRSYRVTIGESELNTLLRTDARAKRLFRQHQIERPLLQMQKDRLRISALVRLQGQRLHVAAEGRMLPNKKGRLLFRADRVWLGKMPAPVAVTKEINRRIGAFGSGGLKLPGRIRVVRLEPGHLILEGVAGKGGQ